VSPFFNVNVGPHEAFCETVIVVGAGDAEPVIGKTLNDKSPNPPPIIVATATFWRRSFDVPGPVVLRLIAILALS
jgi:hypothetical protein